MGNPPCRSTKWAGLILFAALASGSWVMGPVRADVQEMSAQELQRRGHELGEATLRLDGKLEESNDLRSRTRGTGLDTRKLVENFIPLGTSFKDANEILELAGYTVNKSVQLLTRNKERITWAKLTLATGFGYQRWSSVMLYAKDGHDPAEPGATVEKIVANVITDTL